MAINNIKPIKKSIQWLLIIVVILYILSGLGITQFRIIEPLTLGVLTKPVSFKIHDVLLAPFVVLIAVHILFSFLSRLRQGV